MDTAKKKTNGLATAAIIFAILGALGLIFVFPPFLFGSTAIALGLLSGTREGMGFTAKIAIIMGALSMIILIVCIVSAIHFIMTNPEILQNFEEVFREVYEELKDTGVYTVENSFT